MQKEAMFNKCPSCGREIKGSARFCPDCGRPLYTSQPGKTPVLNQPRSSRPTTLLTSQPGKTPVLNQPRSSGPESTSQPDFKLWLSKQKLWLSLGVISIIIGVILKAFSPWIIIDPSAQSSTPGPGETKAPNGNNIGVNDGSFAPFDVWWSNKSVVDLKVRAAQELGKGNRAGAMALWQSELNSESSDAETLIYMENQRILESGKLYLTLIVGVAFVASDDLAARRQLQGIYVAQHEYNSSGSSPFKLRILIANSGSEVPYTQQVATQIAQVASHDQTIVGVIGWLTASRSYEALPLLSKAKIPQVSPQATDDNLTGISPYFFRIVPPNKVQAQPAAKFAEQELKVKKLVVFLDPEDNSSQNLAHDFEVQLVKDGYPKPQEETFTTGKTKDFLALIQNAEQYNPDAFYFTSSDNVDTGLFQDALPITGKFVNLPVISGDGGYVAHKNSYNRWYFTDFAYPDEWSLVVRKDYPPFFQDYSADFNPDGQKPGGYYGYSRADDHAILSYDAASVLLAGVQQALAQGKTMPTAQDVANALPQITGDQAFQGVSGQIAFDTNHDPANKAVVFLYTSADGHLQMKSVQGCFIKGCP